MNFYDISNWKSHTSSTKGTRDKDVLFEPDTGDIYFIKFPMIREQRDYSMETWSEIIAYEVGTILGFNVLRYDFAILDGRAGCISKNMVGNSNESLVEGDSILMAYDPAYSPEDKKSYERYTFPFVMNALRYKGLEIFANDFVKILIFDAIIGNSDRHQSNWGFIQTVSLQDDRRKTFFSVKSTQENNPKVAYSMTPIYDSGCCLGREYNEEQIVGILNDKNKFESFINKGCAELRSDDNPQKKKNHFDLLKYIISLEINWKEFVLNEIERVALQYNKAKSVIEEAIIEIDKPLPPEIRSKYGVSDKRKHFIINVIDTRVNELKKIANVSKD